MTTNQQNNTNNIGHNNQVSDFTNNLIHYIFTRHNNSTLQYHIAPGNKLTDIVVTKDTDIVNTIGIQMKTNVTGDSWNLHAMGPHCKDMLLLFFNIPVEIYNKLKTQQRLEHISVEDQSRIICYLIPYVTT
jgi:hypothetical protein